jgi:hypothetical protein
MRRRSFLITTLVSLLAPRLAPARPAAPQPTAPVEATALPTTAEAATTPAPAAILLQQSPLAGFQYHQGPQLWVQLQPGQTLSLVRESANPYDPRAVRIDWNGAKLGYLPRLDNAAASQLLDRGERLTACIATLAEDRDPWRRVSVEVCLTPLGPARKGQSA